MRAGGGRGRKECISPTYFCLHASLASLLPFRDWISRNFSVSRADDADRNWIRGLRTADRGPRRGGSLGDCARLTLDD